MNVRSYPSAVAVERAVDLLYMLAERGEASLPDLAREIGSSRSAVRRILTALKRKGLVDQDPQSERYALSWLVLTLAKARQDRLSLREVALDPMTDLRDATGETVTLSLLSGFQRVCIEQVEGSHEVRWQGEIGRIDVLYAGASGKVLLAFLPEEDRHRYLTRVKRCPLTPNTFVDRHDLEAELDRIRSQGYALGRQDRVIGVAGASAPIFNEHGTAFAAVGVAAPAQRSAPEQLEAWGPMAKKTAARISDLLGSPPQTNQ